MVVIVTGAIGAGKTTVCEKTVGIARSQGIRCGGIITRKITRNNQDDDIVVEDIQTGKCVLLASTCNMFQGPRTARYSFSPAGLDFGIQAIDRGVSSDILLVDELGQVELGGEGFSGVIEQVASGMVKNCILVIRKGLLPAYLSRLRVDTQVFETTVNNRNQLPEEIIKVLTVTGDNRVC